jgi:hypothetical protein
MADDEAFQITITLDTDSIIYTYAERANAVFPSLD